MTIAYDIWYKYVNERAIDEGATSYKKFVDVPKTVLSTMKRVFETEIKAKCCDVNNRIGKRRDLGYDFCRYLAMYWTYLDCAKDTTTQRFFPTQMTITKAAEIFGYEPGENPFKMNGKFYNFTETGREINAIPDEKVGEIIDEFMKDEPDEKICDPENPVSSENIEDIPVEDFDFSIRTYNCLRLRANIKTLGDILNTPLCDLVKIRNFGRRSLEEVQKVLKKYGYKYIIGDPEHYEDKPALVIDNLKAADALAKKMSDLEKENKELKSQCGNLQKTNVELAKDKLKRMNEDKDVNGKLQWLESRLHQISDENIRLKNDYDKLSKEYGMLKDAHEKVKANCADYAKNIKSAEDCNINYLINVILRKLDENHQPFLITVIDDMLVDIHSKEFEPKKPVRDYGSYSIRMKEGIV